MRLISILGPLLLAACVTSPSRDGDFVVYGEEPEGPGVFSGDRGEFVLFEDSDKPASPVDPGNSPIPSRADDSALEWEEFSAFKRWLEAREAQDQDYQEFLQWRRYEAFKIWQQSQPLNPDGNIPTD